MAIRRLEIGSGNRPLPGYEHLDIDPNCPDVDFCCSMDCIPVEDNSFDEIRSIHTIEHIGWRRGFPTLQEWYRILKPGGMVDIITPNLNYIARAYIENGAMWKRDFEQLHPDEKKHLMVKGFHCHTMWANFKLFSSGAGGDEHMACYDRLMLCSMLEQAGYRNIKVTNDTDCLGVQAWK